MPLRVVGLDGSDDRVLVEEDAVAGAWSPSGRRIAGGVDGARPVHFTPG